MWVLLLRLLPLTQTLCAADGAGPVQIGAHVAGPLAAGFWDVSNANAGPGAGVGAYEQAGSSLGRAVAELCRVPLVQTSIQSRAALEGLLSDDGPPTGPLSAAHGALDGGRPVLVCAVFTGPLGSQLAHRHSAAVGGSAPSQGSSADPLSRRAHSKQRTLPGRVHAPCLPPNPSQQPQQQRQPPPAAEKPTPVRTRLLHWIHSSRIFTSLWAFQGPYISTERQPPKSRPSTAAPRLYSMFVCSPSSAQRADRV